MTMRSMHTSNPEGKPDLPAPMSRPSPEEVSSARLPQSYEAARQALTNCYSIDECKGWADKAQALASYARQANDDTLHKTAARIQGRAIRRVGELLKTFDGRGGDRSKSTGGGTFAPTQKQAADRAGLSKRQRDTAVRVANVPSDEFEKQIESDKPPTVTALAEQGIKRREAPPHMKRATHAWGVLNEFAEWCDDNAPDEIAQGIYPQEVAGMRNAVAKVDRWMDRFVVNLRG